MRKSCLKSANNEDAHQSMHPHRSVHATYKNIENELSHSWSRHSKDTCSCIAKFKVLSSGPFSGFVVMRDTQIYPFSHQSDTFTSSFLSDYALGCQILQKTQIRLLAWYQSDSGS